jgi:hypothetical protein
MRHIGGFRTSLGACLLAAGALLPLPSPALAEIFKWVDENNIVHYTANRASIPIKFQDTVKIVETPPEAPPLIRREVALPDTALPAGVPGVEEQDLSDVPARPRDGRTDVTGDLLQGGRETPRTGAESAGTRPAPVRSASLGPSARLPLKEYVGKSEGWWRSHFYQSRQAVDRQQAIVDAHRKKLREIIKSHAGGNEVLPLEDDPDFQKMANILPREENRLNQLKRNLRKLEARAQELRVPDSWRE